MSRSRHFSAGHGMSDEDEDGPFCTNCATDFEQVAEWQDMLEHVAAKKIHPDQVLPCVNCGAKP